MEDPTTAVYSANARAVTAAQAKLFKGVKVKPPAKQAKTTSVGLNQVPPSSPGQITPTLPGQVKPSKKVKRVKTVKPSKQVNAKNGKAPNDRRLQEVIGLDMDNTVPIEQIYLLAT